MRTSEMIYLAKTAARLMYKDLDRGTLNNADKVQALHDKLIHWPKVLPPWYISARARYMKAHKA